MVTIVTMLFVGFILAGVFLNLYYLAFSIVAVFFFGLENEFVLNIAYWVCLVAGLITSFCVIRKAWPTNVKAKQSNSDHNGH